MDAPGVTREVSLDVKCVAGVVTKRAGIGSFAKAGGGALDRVDHHIEFGIVGSRPVARLAADGVVESSLVGNVAPGTLRVETLLQAQAGR
jgi:hypothetical protein